MQIYKTGVKRGKHMEGQKMIIAKRMVWVLVLWIMTGGIFLIGKKGTEGVDSVQKEKMDVPYVRAYYDFLTEYAKDNLPDAKKIPKFDLIYIDNDDIPELLILEDDCHAAGVKVYSYYDGEVVEIGDFGSFGKMQYVEKEGLIFSHFMGQGDASSDFLKMEDGKAELLFYLHSYPDCNDRLKDLYEIDNVSVSEEVFNEKWKELYEDRDFIFIGYEDGIPINETNLKEALLLKVSE